MTIRPFISYAREDRQFAEKLYHDLRNRGAEPWIDIEDLRAGQNWELAITRAISESSHFFALLSKHSVNKRGFVQREMKHALEVLQLFPPDEVFVVPIRLDDTTPRDLRLSKLHWVDLYPNYDDGLRLLLKSVGLESKAANDNGGASPYPSVGRLPFASSASSQLHLFPLNLLFCAFSGLAISLAYGMCASGLLYLVHGVSEATQFLEMYIGLFGTLVSLGLIIATALVVRRYGRLVPASIEAVFTSGDLTATDYFARKARFHSVSRTVTFATAIGALGFVISSLSRFPLYGLAEALMISTAYIQWILIAYVARKLFYCVLMLQSVVSLKVGGDVFRERQLDVINAVIRLVATAMVIFLYVLTRSNHDAPFMYNSAIGTGARVLLLGPSIAATATFVVLHFLPREALRQIYSKSIDAEVAQRGVSGDAQVSLESRLRGDLRRSYQPSLTDVPIALAAAITVLEFVVYH